MWYLLEGLSGGCSPFKFLAVFLTPLALLWLPFSQVTRILPHFPALLTFVFVLRTSLKKWIVPISDLSQKMNLPFSSLKQATTTTKFFSHLFLILEKLNEVKFPRLLVASPFTLQFSTFCFHSSSKVHYPTSDAFCSLQMSAVRWEVKWLQQPTDPIKIEHQHAKAETASHRIPKCSFAFAPYDQSELRLCWVLSTFIKHVCMLKKLFSAGCKVRF